MANVLKRDKQEAIIRCLVDGNSIRATERITGVHRDTIMRLMVRVGNGCAKVMDHELRSLTCERVQVDEIWGFIYKKQRHVGREDDITRVGDVWTWVAIDADTKLIPSYLVGKRTSEAAKAFVDDLAGRLDNKCQLSSDGLRMYVEAVFWAFAGDVDYGQVVKSYEAEPIGPGRYSPPKVVSVERTAVFGKPNMEKVSTSHVERQNLTMRMCMRRLTRLTNGFSKKLENHVAATALHFAYYNFCRVHRSIKQTPAMAAGVMFQPWTVGDLLDAALEAA